MKIRREISLDMKGASLGDLRRLLAEVKTADDTDPVYIDRDPDSDGEAICVVWWEVD